MRAFLISLLFLSFSLVGFSQDYSFQHPSDSIFGEFSCATQDTIFSDRYLENYNLPSSRSVLRSQRSQSDLDSLEHVVYYIPVIFNILTAENTYQEFTPDGLSITDPALGERIIQLLNEAFSDSGLSVFGEYPELGPGVSLNSQKDTKIRFFKGDRTVDGEPGNEWFRVYDMDTLQYMLGGPVQFLNTVYENMEIPMLEKESGGISGPNTFSFKCMDGETKDILCQDIAYYHHKYLNIWINACRSPTSGVVGQAYFPSYFNGWVFMNGHGVTLDGYKHVLAHELGHFFNLFHTFTGNITCTDVQDELDLIAQSPTICESTGDKICDTTPVAFLSKSHPCHDPSSGYHCQSIEGIDNQSNNFMNYTPRDYTCDAFYFTSDQIDEMRATLETATRRKSIADHGRFLMGTDTYCNSDAAACNYNPYYQGDGECLYFDAFHQCGGGCSDDIDKDLICDDIDPVVDPDGTLGIDQNNNGIPDNIDPCGSISDIDGIIDYVGTKIPVKAMALGNRCWSSLNLMTTVFSNGDPIVTLPSPMTSWVRHDYLLQEDNGDERPGLYTYYTSHPDKGSKYKRIPRSYINSQGGPHSVMYNWYAVHDERGLCPTGWHVSTDDDWEDLERFIGFQEYEIVRNDRKSAEPVTRLIYNHDFLNSHWQISSYEYYNPVTVPDPLAYYKSASTGYLNRYGHRMEVGLNNYFWTSDDTKRNNSIFRRLQTQYRGSTKANRGVIWWGNADLDRITGMEGNRDSRLNAASVRCVKDVN